jgi:hypothetical protein
MILLAFLLANWGVQLYQFLHAIDAAARLAALAVESLGVPIVFVPAEGAVERKRIAVYQRGLHSLVAFGANHKRELLFRPLLHLPHKDLALVSALNADLEIEFLPDSLADNWAGEAGNMQISLFVLLLAQ